MSPLVWISATAAGIIYPLMMLPGVIADWFVDKSLGPSMMVVSVGPYFAMAMLAISVAAGVLAVRQHPWVLCWTIPNGLLLAAMLVQLVIVR